MLFNDASTKLIYGSITDTVGSLISLFGKPKLSVLNLQFLQINYKYPYCMFMTFIVSIINKNNYTLLTEHFLSVYRC